MNSPEKWFDKESYLNYIPKLEIGSLVSMDFICIMQSVCQEPDELIVLKELTINEEKTFILSVENIKSILLIELVHTNISEEFKKTAENLGSAHALFPEEMIVGYFLFTEKDGVISKGYIPLIALENEEKEFFEKEKIDSLRKVSW